MQISLINGKADLNLSPNSRALAFGDGLFETLLIRQGSPVSLDLHAERLQRGCDRLSIPLDIAYFYQDIQIALQLINASQSSSDWRLKYMVSRGDSRTGYACSEDVAPQRIVIAEPFTRDVEKLQKQGVRVRSCDWRLPKHSGLAGIKHLNRLDQVMARAEWTSPDIFEGLMADTSGHWIEGTMSNLFVVDSSGCLVTPDLSESGVSGVMRRQVIEKLSPPLGLEVRETVILSLEAINEMFLTNALIGIVPVIQLDDRVLPIGPVTQSLQAQLATTNQ